MNRPWTYMIIGASALAALAVGVGAHSAAQHEQPARVALLD